MTPAVLLAGFLHAHNMHAPRTGVTVLVDPWLEGDLVFASQTWLYRGSKGALKDVKLDLDQIGSQADVILLSQVALYCTHCCRLTLYFTHD